VGETDLRSRLRKAAPSLVGLVDDLAGLWLGPALARLDGVGPPRFPKTLNDVVWGTIELLPGEVVLLDTPLLQRLRGIRQLGMAHLVYPGAGYDRLEHSCGVVEAAQQILSSLARNAANRRRFSRQPDAAIPEPSDRDRAATRLGALLHDVGHTPFSHATEHLIATQYGEEFDAATAVLLDAFAGTTTIQPSEQMAALIVLSGPMRRVLEHTRFDVHAAKDQLAEAITARILGSRDFLDATYLSGVVSGPLDADKIDYMARDSHHAGVPLGLDSTRLVSKLEVVTVTPENALTPELRERAEKHPTRRFYELGISRAGLSAYEQMIIARVTLYERLYYHHKIRAAEGMARNLIEARGRSEPVALRELYQNLTDDTMVCIWGGILTAQNCAAAGDVAADMAERIRSRNLFHRAYSFSSRFIAGLEGLPKDEQSDTKGVLWSAVTGELELHEGTRDLARAIYDRAAEIGNLVPRFRDAARKLVPEHIVVDLPQHNRVARGGDILTTSDTGQIRTANLFFQAEKWVDAYTQQKQCGYVFAPREAIVLVALASRLVFYEKFNLVMNQEADVAAKTHGMLDDGIFAELIKQGLCGAELVEMVRNPRPSLIRTRADHLEVPEDIALDDPTLKERLARELAEAVPHGLPASIHENVVKSIHAMLRVLQILDQGGKFNKSGAKPDEKRELQPAIRDYLRARDVPVLEGAEYGGGETDLLLFNSLIVENKVVGSTCDPFGSVESAGLQARRYAIAISQRVRFILAAYHPPTDADLPNLSQRVRARPAAVGDGAVEIVFLVPYGHGVPSRAGRRPTVGGSASGDGGE